MTSTRSAMTRIDRLAELIARAGWVGEGIEPGSDADLHVREEHVQDGGADAKI